MNLKLITQALGELTSLVKNFDATKALELITRLKSASPEDLNKFVDMLKPIAGGQVSSTLQQLIKKVDSASLAQFQQSLSKVDFSKLKALAGQITGGKAGDSFDKAKGVLQGLLKK